MIQETKKRYVELCPYPPQIIQRHNKKILDLAYLRVQEKAVTATTAIGLRYWYW